MKGLNRIAKMGAMLLLLGWCSVCARSQDATSAASESSQPLSISASTDKARYEPGRPVQLAVVVDNSSGSQIQHAFVSAEVQDLGRGLGEFRREVSIDGRRSQELQLTLTPPPANYHGYRIEVHLMDGRGRQLATTATAIDVSSDWARFPRYGYLAHYDANIPAEKWVAELNRFHIDGLQFYDYQYKHHIPVPPPALVNSSWPDIANRVISSKTLRAFLSAAKEHNMTTMAYNASYAAYADAFNDGSGVKLQWATWPDADGPRTEARAKDLPMPPNWATNRLIYMNQDSPGWRNYIFGQMRRLLEVFPFDGWHIDSFGDSGAFAWDGSPIKYYKGFASFADAASAALHRPILLNTVGAHGQIAMAKSAVDFVYSELWPEDHSTYASILSAADEVHAVNQTKGVVFAAYLHRDLSDRLQKEGGEAQFDTPGVLLADAVIFASGADHIELGDGDRMLSNPYFPADTNVTVSEDLKSRLRSYYDFLVAYENYLRDGVLPASFEVRVSNARQTTKGDAGAVWTITRQKGNDSIVHLINFTGLKQTEWRDDGLNYPPAPVLRDVKVTVQVPGTVTEVGWVSPDIEGGRWHPLPIRKSSDSPTRYETTVPELRYWTVLIFRHQ